MEVRIVNFNIKQFIEDYIFCVESRDKEGKKNLLERFDEVFKGSCRDVQVGIKSYLSKSEVAKDYKELQRLSRRRIKKKI